jgi:hypothetical protein
MVAAKEAEPGIADDDSARALSLSLVA